MKAEFWHELWQKGELGFHETEVNPLLIRHFPNHQLPVGSKVLIPLCGKSRDMLWLLAQGYEVIGIELSELAVMQFFKDLGMAYELVTLPYAKCFRGPNITIFCGDIFDLTQGDIDDLTGSGEVRLIYDRAALVALPDDMRTAYAAQLQKLTNSAPQLVVTYLYDASLLTGPPFSINQQLISDLYGQNYQFKLLESQDDHKGIRGVKPVTEQVWYLS